MEICLPTGHYCWVSQRSFNFSTSTLLPLPPSQPPQPITNSCPFSIRYSEVCVHLSVPPNTTLVYLPHVSPETAQGFLIRLLCLHQEIQDTKASVCLFTQSCPTLFDPVDSSPSGSSVHGILQARILEWFLQISRDLPDPGFKPMSLVSPALAGRFFITNTT